MGKRRYTGLGIHEVELRFSTCASVYKQVKVLKMSNESTSNFTILYTVTKDEIENNPSKLKFLIK